MHQLSFASRLLTVLASVSFWVAAENTDAMTLKAPTRRPDAAEGADLAKMLMNQALTARENLLVSKILEGNLPGFLRSFCPISVTNIGNGKTNIVIFFVAPDYLSVGSNEDYLLIPLTPFNAQKVADALDCVLPTTKMVDLIYSNAPVKLKPAPIPPSDAMTTIPVFQAHNSAIRQQRNSINSPLGTLTAGHKKDVVITAKLKSHSGKVAIYGWHRIDGTPIQPLYLGHTTSWVDYSHGIRLVHEMALVNGQPQSIEAILRNPDLACLLSNEGAIVQPRYSPDTETFPFEQSTELHLDNGIRILINSPPPVQFKKNITTKLILYGLPNGNTIEQTMGKRIKPGDDWHFDIQHIGAQTRFLRQKLSNENIVVVYLENNLKSWPAWRRKHGDQQIPPIISSVKSRFKNTHLKIVLTGHSGGGSFTFGYLNCVETIPDEITRIAFLDSNYAYETELHRDKLANWLNRSNEHFLTVIAYHDSIALLNGKTFVSAEGGTWGRSHLMKRDLETQFKFTEGISPEFHNYSALNGRVQFLLKENPEKKIFHTVQVERNGFIHSILAGTPLENEGYAYFGKRAYENWIAE